MRLKIFAAFSFGFAAGMLCLAVGLWWTGRLYVPGLPIAHAEQPQFKLVLEPQPAMDALRNPPPSASTPAPPPVELEKPGGPAMPTVAMPTVTMPTVTMPTVTMPTLAMPIKDIDPSKLRSNFEEARGGHRHEALDIMAPRGTPVMAVAQGNVVKLFTSKPGGLTVYQFDDSQTYCYYYAHLDRYAPGLKEGTLLRKGDVLGFVGSTGDASPDAPHLHLAVFRLGPEKQWWKGTALDPLPFFK